MDFSSLKFLFVFLPVFISIYLIAKPSLRLGLVLIASGIFLVAGQTFAIFWLGGIGLIGYVLGRLIEARKKEAKNSSGLVWLGIGLNLGLLLAFKWLNVYRSNFSIGTFQLESLVAPLGLSYITFQSISYLVDVSRNTAPAEKNIINYLTYILFFPKLVSGPITRYKQFSGQLGSLTPSTNDIAAGLRRVLIGVFKHAFIANQLSIVVNAVFNLPTPNIEPRFAWLALIAYTLQIFFDFSGYTDIALGLGKIIGITLPENFNHPYTAQSISDFWQRWHITLSTWFREYVFYPLERRRLKFAGQQINLIIVFLLTGLWHGLTTNFLLWGLLHGLAIAFESAGGGRWLKNVWRPFRHFYTLAVVLVGWVFFRSSSLTFAFGFFSRLAGNTSGLTKLPFRQTTPLPFIEPSFVLVLIVGIIFCLPLASLWNTVRTNLEKQKPALFFIFQPAEDLFLIALFILGLAALFSNSFAPNIYAKF